MNNAAVCLHGHSKELGIGVRSVEVSWGKKAALENLFHSEGATSLSSELSRCPLEGSWRTIASFCVAAMVHHDGKVNRNNRRSKISVPIFSFLAVMFRNKKAREETERGEIVLCIGGGFFIHCLH